MLIVGGLRMSHAGVPIVTDGTGYFFLSLPKGEETAIAETIVSALSTPAPCIGVRGTIINDAIIVEKVYV